MTWLQALVALALFAPGAVAPSAHLDIPSLSMFSTAVFAVGVVTSFLAGGLINHIGSLRMASLCAGAVVASMALAAFGSGPALLLAGLCLGLAFGPETPSSTALLGRLVTDERRPLVFSIRQTGNQIGAVCGSLALPAIAVWLAPQWSYATVGACAVGGIIVFEWLRPRYEGLPQAPPLSRSVYANSGSATSKPVPRLPAHKQAACWGGSAGVSLQCASIPHDWS
jgi:MFS family permease